MQEKSPGSTRERSPSTWSEGMTGIYRPPPSPTNLPPPTKTKMGLGSF